MSACKTGVMCQTKQGACMACCRYCSICSTWDASFSTPRSCRTSKECQGASNCRANRRQCKVHTSCIPHTGSCLPASRSRELASMRITDCSSGTERSVQESLATPNAVLDFLARRAQRKSATGFSQVAQMVTVLRLDVPQCNKQDRTVN